MWLYIFASVFYAVLIFGGIWVMGHISTKWSDVPHFDRWLKKDRYGNNWWFWEKK